MGLYLINNIAHNAKYKEYNDVVRVFAKQKKGLISSIFSSAKEFIFIISTESPIMSKICIGKECEIDEKQFRDIEMSYTDYKVEIALHVYEERKSKRITEERKKAWKESHTLPTQNGTNAPKNIAEKDEENKERTAEEAKHIPSQRTTPTISMKEVDEQFHSSKRKMKTKIVNGIVSYFNGYDDLRRAKVFGTYDLVPLVPETILDDIEQIKSVQNDIQTAKCMPQLYGSGCTQYFSAYLQNTYICTDMGIAFGYAIRENATMDPMEINYGPMIGFIKITSPSHNKMTNNFDGWLIDYLTLPKHRGKGLMKLAVNRVLDKLDSMGVEEVYAMVDNDNTPSLRILAANQFVQSRKPGGINPTTGKPFIILVHRFD